MYTYLETSSTTVSWNLGEKLVQGDYERKTTEAYKMHQISKKLTESMINYITVSWKLWKVGRKIIQCT